MAILRKETYTAYLVNEDNKEHQFPSKDEALKFAREYVGNNSYSKPIPKDDVYLFGPGDGTTSVMVRQDVEFV